MKLLDWQVIKMTNDEVMVEWTKINEIIRLDIDRDYDHFHTIVDEVIRRGPRLLKINLPSKVIDARVWKAMGP